MTWVLLGLVVAGTVLAGAALVGARRRIRASSGDAPAGEEEPARVPRVPAPQVRAPVARPPATPTVHRPTPRGPRVEEVLVGGATHLRALFVGPPEVTLVHVGAPTHPPAERDRVLGDVAFDAVTVVTAEDPRWLALLDPGFRTWWASGTAGARLEHGTVTVVVPRDDEDEIDRVRAWLEAGIAHRVGHPFPGSEGVDDALRAACRGDPEPGVRAALLEVLCTVDLEAARALAQERSAAGGDPALRRSALRALNWASTLAETLATEPLTDDEVDRAVRQLAKLADPTALATGLRALAGRASARPWEALLAAVGDRPTEEVIAALADVGSTGSPRHRRSLARALGRWEDPAVEPIALALLGDTESEVALGAAAVLRTLGSHAALVPLLERCQAGPPEVVAAATAALRVVRARVGDLAGAVSVPEGAPEVGAVSPAREPGRGRLTDGEP